MGKFTKVAVTGVLVLLLVSVAVCGSVAWYVFSPVSASAATTAFIIVKGDTVKSIAEKLTAKGLIRSSLSVRLLYRLNGKSQAIQPGTYSISSAMAPAKVLEVLFSETQDVWVTLQEGWRVEEMAEEIAMRLHPTFSKDEFVLLAKPVEGKLFPDTYLFSKDMTAAAVFSKLTSTFASKYSTAVKAEGEGVLPPDKTVILASLVEREGRGEADSRMVAGILLNRLRADMPLQVDATLQYAKGYDVAKKTWWGAPKASDKESRSPYNTYAIVGLPPGAICNPGLLSLKAALGPTPSKYFYYLHDTNGSPHYATTYEEHQMNIEKYLR